MTNLRSLALAASLMAGSALPALAQTVSPAPAAQTAAPTPAQTAMPDPAPAIANPATEAPLPDTGIKKAVPETRVRHAAHHHHHHAKAAAPTSPAPTSR